MFGKNKMLTRASRILFRKGVRHVSGSEVVAASTNVGAIIGPTFIIAGGIYALDSKIETKTNHLDTKLDTLTQVVNGVNVSVARIEEHIRRG